MNLDFARRVATLFPAALMLAACGTTAGPGTPAASPSPSGSPVAQATGDIAFQGDSDVGVPLTKVTIQCSVPRFEGLSILVYGAPKDHPGINLFMQIYGGGVNLGFSQGTGSNFSERDFAGTGLVSGYDPAAGAQLNGNLTEKTGAKVNKGSLGAVTSVSGSIHCDGQSTGTSDIQLTGDAQEGQIDGPFSPTQVSCNLGSRHTVVIVQGLTSVGGHRAEAVLTIAPDQAQVSLRITGGSLRRYYTQPGGTVSGTRGQIDVDLPEAASSDSGGHVVHAKGSATCGSTSSY